MPALETLEKFARALEVPTYEIFYDGEEPPEPLAPMKSKGAKSAWGSSGKDAATLRKFRQCLGRVSKNDLKLLMHMAQRRWRDDVGSRTGGSIQR